MDKDEMKNHNCDNVNCNHNDTKGLCCLHNPDNCKYRQLQKESAELKKENENLASIAEHQQSSNMKRYFEIEELKRKNTELEEKLANADYQLEGRDNEIAELKKACDETQELLDKQIEATFKLDKENAKAKEIIREFTLGFDTQGQYDRLQAKAEAFLNSEV